MSSPTAGLEEAGLAAVRFQKRIRGRRRAAPRRFEGSTRFTKVAFVRSDVLLRWRGGIWRGSNCVVCSRETTSHHYHPVWRTCRQARDRRKVLFDAWYEGLLKLGDQMFEELADSAGVRPRAPPGRLLRPPPPGVPPAEVLKDSDEAGPAHVHLF